MYKKRKEKREKNERTIKEFESKFEAERTEIEKLYKSLR